MPLDAGVRHLSTHRVPEARASAEFILAGVLGAGRGAAALDGGRSLTAAQRRRFWSLIRRRCRRLPLAYVLGHQDFMGLRMTVSPAVFTPRPETEELVDEAQGLMRAAGLLAPRILDIGTGSGCVAISLAKRFRFARIWATDVSARALALARRNAHAHGVAGRIKFLKKDLFLPWTLPKADLIVSNPPYVPASRLRRLAVEVRCEPRPALDGGKDGLDAVGAVVRAAAKGLKPGGRLVMEIGHDQGARVKTLLREAGFGEPRVKKDMQGLDRIAVARYPR
ncbi:MAG: peptide chain release factor N(5)-glutamine methyltransferase [Elusimicrobia bacterium]|nr:peptide chain release factor N(5)-glutamine methyltransferase [Elusimicrobiota bacterium]